MRKNKKEIKISIIIPVHNSAEEIERCLTSIKNQTYKNFEAIIVDDDSTDDTPKIIELKTAHDDRFRVYRVSPNKGVAFARNLGIAKSNGEYLTFIDSDDVVHSRYLEMLLEVALRNNRALVSISEVLDVYDEKNVPLDWEIGNKIPTVYCKLDSFFDYNFSAGITSWGSLYRKDIIKNLRFDANLQVGEDTLFWAQAFVMAGGVERVNAPLYCYVHYPESLLHGELNEKRYSEIVAWEQVGQYFEKYAWDKFNGKFRASYYLAYVIRLKEKYSADVSGRYKSRLYLKVKKSCKEVILGNVALKSKLSILFFLISPPVYCWFKRIGKNI